MQIEQRTWTEAHGWAPELPGGLSESARLMLVFGATSVLRKQQLLEQVKRYYPHAHILGCSTAGEICGTRVSDDSLVITAVSFQHTSFRGAQIELSQVMDSFQAGKHLAQAIPPSVPSETSADKAEELVHILVLSDGLHVNGSDLVRGLTEYLPEKVTVTGGLAGDGARFGETCVFWDQPPARDVVAALGFYGKRLRIGFGSLGGWDSFGPERLITHSKGNVLYEMDGHSALGLYKKYLGEHAKELPAAGLLFPLSIRTRPGEIGVVRTILSVDEQEQSMTFAGDVPEGAYARLMKANFDRLIDGAIGAAHTSCQTIGSISPDLAILISCVGRKLVLRQRIEEEVEGVRDVLGEHTALTGFYSYGEISPFTLGSKCELHNQTMTITTFSEE
ncbi:hypothetical protein U27_06760 [Candidatus Vecturithrix granuli]|uniref:Uncharacterized protein n=1 Tax=Vecturithrix granuli TaxID=1499967 RepID=A0A081C5C0_VECG1|nr:hypothetical protein U27_06760 [Candidatus Vecturithrix granuli]